MMLLPLLRKVSIHMKTKQSLIDPLQRLGGAEVRGSVDMRTFPAPAHPGVQLYAAGNAVRHAATYEIGSYTGSKIEFIPQPNDVGTLHYRLGSDLHAQAARSPLT